MRREPDWPPPPPAVLWWTLLGSIWATALVQLGMSMWEHWL